MITPPDGIATRVGAALVSARTRLLRAIGPLERLRRGAPAQSGLPPLWLRRHAGPLSRYASSAREMAKLVDDLGALQPSDDVLEIGCGPGALAAELAPRLGPGRRYVGFDVHAPSIEWCRSRFAGDPRLVFELVRARSAYATRTGPPVSSIRFPMEDGAAGHVVAKSVFTHLFEEDARHYLGEIARVLRRGRGAVVTAFLFDPAHSDEVSRAFPRGDGAVRWRSGLRPEAGVAYELSRFQAMTVEAGLRIVWMSRGYFPGAARATGQDVLLLGY